MVINENAKILVALSYDVRHASNDPIFMSLVIKRVTTLLGSRKTYLWLAKHYYLDNPFKFQEAKAMPLRTPCKSVEKAKKKDTENNFYRALLLKCHNHEIIPMWISYRAGELAL